MKVNLLKRIDEREFTIIVAISSKSEVGEKSSQMLHVQSINRNSRTMYKIFPNLTKMRQERHQLRRPGVLIVNFIFKIFF